MKKNRQHIHNRYLIRLLVFFIHKASFGLVKVQTATGSVLNEENKPVNGIITDIDNCTLYPNGAADPAVAYNAANTLQLINTQYWIACITNGAEAWANFRRTGFPFVSPNLSNNNLSGGFIHRLSYPDYESSNNKTNYFKTVQAAIGGTDNLTTKAFWDY
jgi:Susd and RagB outer membrane lipoprotein